MFYEIFASMANVGSPIAGYIGFILASTYLLFIVGFLLSWLYSFSYSFVFEGKKEKPNWLFSKIKSLTSAYNHSSLDGWYRSRDVGFDPYWAYRKFDKGRYCDYSDSNSGREILRPNPDIKKRTLTLFNSWDPVALSACLPLFFSAFFLFADFFPAVTACIALYFGGLIGMRNIIRLTERFKSHLTDPNAHKGDESS